MDWVRQKREEVLANATPSQRRSLLIDHHYGAPYSFWSAARVYGLATNEDVEKARVAYGSLWHYRGD